MCFQYVGDVRLYVHAFVCVCMSEGVCVCVLCFDYNFWEITED